MWRACSVHVVCKQRACGVHAVCTRLACTRWGDAPANFAARKSCGDALRSSWSMWCCAKMAHLAPRLSQASPLVGCSCCVSRCRSVDLPAPFGLRSTRVAREAHARCSPRPWCSLFPWRERVLRAACWPRVGRVEQWAWSSGRGAVGVEQWAWRRGPGGKGRGGWPVVAHVQRRPAPQHCHSLPPGSGARAPRCARRARRRAAARSAAAPPWPG